MELNLDVQRMGSASEKRCQNTRTQYLSMPDRNGNLRFGRLLFPIVCYFNGFGSDPCLADVFASDLMSCSKLFFIEHFDWMNELVHVVCCHHSWPDVSVYGRYVHNIFVSAKPCVEFPLNFLKLSTPLNSTTLAKQHHQNMGWFDGWRSVQNWNSNFSIRYLSSVM